MRTHTFCDVSDDLMVLRSQHSWVASSAREYADQKLKDQYQTINNAVCLRCLLRKRSSWSEIVWQSRREFYSGNFSSTISLLQCLGMCRFRGEASKRAVDPMLFVWIRGRMKKIKGKLAKRNSQVCLQQYCVGMLQISERGIWFFLIANLRLQVWTRNTPCAFFIDYCIYCRLLRLFGRQC